MNFQRPEGHSFKRAPHSGMRFQAVYPFNEAVLLVPIPPVGRAARRFRLVLVLGLLVGRRGWCRRDRGGCGLRRLGFWGFYQGGFDRRRRSRRRRSGRRGFEACRAGGILWRWVVLKRRGRVVLGRRRLTLVAWGGRRLCPRGAVPVWSDACPGTYTCTKSHAAAFAALRPRSSSA